MQGNQKKALKALGSFFFGMFLLTLVSKGANTLTTPQVKVSYPRGGKINYEIKAEGELYTKRQEQLKILEGFSIKEIFVEEGDAVKVGDQLIELDKDELKLALEDEHDELRRLMLQMEQLQLQRPKKDRASLIEEVQKTIEQLEEEYNYLMEQEQVKIGRIERDLEEANRKLEIAKKDLEVFKNQSREETSEQDENKLKEAKEKVEQAKKYLDNQQYEREKAIRRAEQSVNDAKENIWLLGGGEATSAIQALERAQMELEITKSDWERTVAEANNSFKKAEELVIKIEDGKESEEKIEGLKIEEEKVKLTGEQVQIHLDQLEDAHYQRQQLEVKYTRDTEKAKNKLEQAKEDIDAKEIADEKVVKNQAITEELLQMDIDKKKQEVEKLQDAYHNDGIVVASIAGVVGALNVQVGDKINDATLIGIIPQEAEYVFEAMVTKDEAKKIEEGDPVTIVLENQELSKENQLVIEKIIAVKDEEGKKLIVKVSEEVKPDAGKIIIKKDSKVYQTIIPIEAIRQDSDGKFVIVAREVVTTLGTQMIATRVPIEEVEKNDKVAAVQGGLMAKDQVVISENKPIEVGDPIRVIEQ